MREEVEIEADWGMGGKKRAWRRECLSSMPELAEASMEVRSWCCEREVEGGLGDERMGVMLVG